MTMTTRSITLAARRFSRQNKRQSQSQSRQWPLQLRELSQSFSSTSSSSFSSMFSALEFPKATEAPIVTRTTAAHARPVTVTAPKDEHDVFDDAGTLSELERSSIQGAQRRMISTTLRNCKPVLSTPPDDIPPPTISCHQDIPTTMVSTLPNGIKVISQETYGHVCTVGILANAGSTMEKVVGTSHLLELTAFQSTSQYHNPIDIQETLQLWGATPFCHIGREQSLWCLDVLRPNVQKGFALLTDCVLNARYTEEEVIASQQIIGFQWTDKKAETMMTDALQRAAFGPDQPLGRHHFCPLDQIDNLHATDLQTFMEKHVRNNPKALVVSGAGIGHDELVDMATRNLGHLQQEEQNTLENGIKSSIYQGGDYKVQHTTEDGFTHVAIGFEIGGWLSTDLVPACVLQSLLGGGSSFSAGGPGKGMYSRLYRQVLNRNQWVESAEACMVFHNEVGLIGITGSSVPKKSALMAQLIRDQLLSLANQQVTDEEFDRARKMLTNSVLMQLESRLVLFEDMGRQALAYGYRENSHEMSRKIDAVTKEDLLQLVRRAICKPPSLAAVGDDVSYVPAYEGIRQWFA